MPRRVLTSVLAVLAAIALSLSLLSGYAKRALFDSDQFANRAAAALDKRGPATSAPATWVEWSTS